MSPDFFLLQSKLVLCFSLSITWAILSRFLLTFPGFMFADFSHVLILQSFLFDLQVFLSFSLLNYTNFSYITLTVQTNFLWHDFVIFIGFLFRSLFNSFDSSHYCSLLSISSSFKFVQVFSEQHFVYFTSWRKCLHSYILVYLIKDYHYVEKFSFLTLSR